MSDGIPIKKILLLAILWAIPLLAAVIRISWHGTTSPQAVTALAPLAGERIAANQSSSPLAATHALNLQDAIVAEISTHIQLASQQRAALIKQISESEKHIGQLQANLKCSRSRLVELNAKFESLNLLKSEWPTLAVE